MTETAKPPRAWFAVRCVVDHADLGVYEEGLTLWQAPTAEAAIGLAEDEVLEYARGLDSASYAGLAQAYELFDEPGHGAEIFSLMRGSALPEERVPNGVLRHRLRTSAGLTGVDH
jgi:hypothetical protein